jgi:hypothetical protein
MEKKTANSDDPGPLPPYRKQTRHIVVKAQSNVSDPAAPVASTCTW